MLRGTVSSKLMRVGRATVFFIGLAVILAVVLGVATAAVGATGGNFILGVVNRAETPTSLISTLADAVKPALVVHNKSGGPALDLRVGNAEVPADEIAPMKVNSTKVVANLNAQNARHADRANSATNAATAANLRCQGCVDADDLDNNAVVGGLDGDVLDDSVTSDDLGTDSVKADELAEGSVDAAALQKGAASPDRITSNGASTTVVGGGSLVTTSPDVKLSTASNFEIESGEPDHRVLVSGQAMVECVSCTAPTSTAADQVVVKWALVRDGFLVGSEWQGVVNDESQFLVLPVSFADTVGAGVHTYQLMVWREGPFTEPLSFGVVFTDGTLIATDVGRE